MIFHCSLSAAGRPSGPVKLQWRARASEPPRRAVGTRAPASPPHAGSWRTPRRGRRCSRSSRGGPAVRRGWRRQSAVDGGGAGFRVGAEQRVDEAGEGEVVLVEVGHRVHARLGVDWARPGIPEGVSGESAPGVVGLGHGGPPVQGCSGPAGAPTPSWASFEGVGRQPGRDGVTANKNPTPTPEAGLL